ncbi:FG-GAP-like repeat-containing protein, partial [bacterium]|nr:FG-GAP-like repeat-containing protein [bacterium]
GDAFLTGPNSGANFYFYESFGTSGQPIYSLVETQFTPNVDIGLHSIPTFVDIDADGDLDLFLSNEEDPEDNLQSHLYFFENEGSAGQPAFSLKTDDFLNLDLGLNLTPAFVDIDHDGDQDLFVGEWDGKLNFLRNNGTAEAPAFDTAEENFAGIDVGNNCTPVFMDIDSDLDFDLVMGERLGKIIFYRNIGSREEPAFQADTTIFREIGVDLYSAPAFGDMDSDGDQDLLVGSDAAGLFFFRNVGTPAKAEFAFDPALSVDVDRRAAPVAADLDADGDLDLVVGGRSGGMMFFHNRKIVSSIAPREPMPIVPTIIRLLQNHPNPFNPETTITYSLSFKRDQLGESHTLTIYNLLGQRVKQWRIPNTQAEFQNSIRWRGLDDSGNSVPSGVYLYTVRVDSQTKLTRKMLLLQ